MTPEKKTETETMRTKEPKWKYKCLPLFREHGQHSWKINRSKQCTLVLMRNLEDVCSSKQVRRHRCAHLAKSRECCIILYANFLSAVVALHNWQRYSYNLFCVCDKSCCGIISFFCHKTISMCNPVYSWTFLLHSDIR